MARIDITALEALEGVVVDGQAVRLTSGQLDRKVYLEVNKVLERLGGRWDRRARAHLFDQDPAASLAAVLAFGDMPADPRKDEGYFATPPDLADRLVHAFTNVDALSYRARVLEPSAGTGPLVDAIHRVSYGDVYVVAVEPNADRAAKIAVADEVHVSTLEDYRSTCPDLFEAVVMNPPFALPGRPCAWIDHVWLAYDLLAPGGLLTSIAPAGLKFRQDTRYVDLRARLADDERSGYALLPDDSFKASGTGVRTCVLWLVKR